MTGPSTEKHSPTGMRVDLGVAWGLIAGAAVGSILMALTGDVMWVSIGPGIGLAVGLAVVGLLSRRRGGDIEDDSESRRE